MDVGNIIFFSLPFSTQTEIISETSLRSTGVSVSLPIFSGGTDLCEADEKMEAMAGYCVWMDDFIHMRSPQKRLIESLFWHLHSEGVCCTVSGPFPANLAGRFKELLIAGLYIAICGTSESEAVRQLLSQYWSS
jgi:hypothetical protein